MKKIGIEEIKDRILGLVSVLSLDTPQKNVFSNLLSDIKFVPLYLLLLKRDKIIDTIEGEASQLPKILPAKLDRKNINHQELYYHFEDAIGRLHKSYNNLLKETFNSIPDEFLGDDFPMYFDELLFEIIKRGHTGLNESALPREISAFINSICQENSNLSIYNPFAGIASFGILKNKDHTYVGQEIRRDIWAIGLMRLLAHSLNESSTFICGDSIDKWISGKDKYDLIVSAPPIGLRLPSSIKSIEHFIIERGLKDIKQTGKIVLLISNRFLFQSGADDHLRRILVEDDLLEMVISFPGGLLSNTNIATTLIVINRNKKLKGEVLFVDAHQFSETAKYKKSRLQSEELFNAIHNNLPVADEENNFIRVVANDKIARFNYNLSVNRYFTNEHIGERLSNLVSVIRGFRSESTFSSKHVRIRDLKDDRNDYVLDLQSVENKELSGTVVLINESCVLVSLKGRKLKPTLFKYTGQPIILYSDILPLKVDDLKISPEYLINELHSENVKNQLVALIVGATIPFLKRADFLDIKINVPSLSEQHNIVKGIKDALLEGKEKEVILEKEIAKIKKEQKEDLRIKKHSIMQYLNNVKSASDLLFKIMNENKGNLNGGFLLNPKQGTTVKTRFEKMQENIDDIIGLIENLTNDIEVNEKEVLQVERLLTEAKERGPNDPSKFDIDIKTDEQSFKDDDDKSLEPRIEFSKKDLIEIYNNIVFNAINHGFTDPKKKYTLNILIKGDLKEDAVIVSFTNDGKPFPAGMAERYHIKGEKAGQTAKSGIGSWKICQLAENNNSRVEAHDFREEAFPVQIDLIIPLIYIS